MIKVSNILRYPLKSCRGEFLNSSEVTTKGLKYDRNWALFGESGQVITGRQHPLLLDIKIDIDDEKVTIVLDDRPQISFEINSPENSAQDVKIFSYDVSGYDVDEAVDNWFSDYLDKKVKLLYTDDLRRPVLPKHGGKADDIVSFADQAPILLLSEESLNDLNERLFAPITFHRFRPNIVIKGCDPYAEDNWTSIQIGEVKFEVIQKCERCIFTTIDPKSKIKHPQKEPLKTLSTYRKKENGGVDFGVHMVPRSNGVIRLEDEILVS